MRFLWLVHLIGIGLRVVLWSLATALALAASVALHLELPISGRVASDLTTQFVNGEIRGELEIGRLDELTPDHIVARFVTLRDGEGRKIIVADRVDLQPDFAQLRRGLLLFKVGRVSRGSIHLIDNGQDEPSLFTTFDLRHPGTGTGTPLKARVDQLTLNDVTLYGQFIQLENVRVEHVNASGTLAIGDQLEVQIHSAQGQMVRPYDFVGNITQVSGTISTDPVRGVQLSVDGTRNDEDVHADVSFRSSAAALPQELQLDLRSRKLTPDTLRRVGFAFAGPLDPPLSGTVQLSGPPEELSLSADVSSEAGEATVSGTISSERGVSVHISSDSLQVDVLVHQAPAVRARGRLDVSVGPEPDARPEVHAEIGAMRYMGLRIPAFVLDGELIDDGLLIEKARATQGGQLALRGEVGFDGHTDLHVNAQFGEVQRDPNLSLFADDLEGSLSTNFHIRTPPIDRPTYLHIDGTLDLHDAKYGSLQARHLKVRGKAHGDPSRPRLNVDVRAEEVQVLEYKLGNARFAARGGPSRYTAEGEFAAKGHKTFSFNAAVQADRNGFVVQAEPIEFTVGTESWRGAIRDLKVLHDDSVALGFLRLGSRAQRLEANGIMRVHGEDSLQAQLQNFDVTALRAVLGERFPLTFGYADASLELRGDVERPELTLTGALREGKLPTLENVDALYAVTYRKGSLELDTDVNLKEHGRLTLAGQGQINEAEPNPVEALRAGLYNLQLAGEQLDVTLIPQLKPVVKSGKVDGEINLKGGLDAVTLQGKLGAKELRILDWQPLEVRSRLKYDHDDLDLQLAARDAIGTVARTHTNWHVDWRSLGADPEGYVEQLKSEDFRAQGITPARTLDALPFPLPWDPPADLRVGTRFKIERVAGDVSGDIEARLTPQRKLYDASCQVTSNTKLTARLGLHNEQTDVTLEAKLNGSDVASGSGQLQWPVASLLRGEVPSIVPRVDLHGSVSVDQIEHVPVLCRHGHGELQANWEISGAGREHPVAVLDLRGQFVPQIAAAQGVASTPVERCSRDPLQVTARANADSGRLSVEAHARGCSGGPAELALDLPWHWDDEHPLPQRDTTRYTNASIDLRQAELEPLLDYVPAVRGFSGLASGQLSARSLGKQLEAKGQLALSGGRLYLIPTGQELTDIAVSVTASGDWLKIDELKARVGRGSFDAKGGLGFSGFTPNRLQLGLVVRELPIQREGIDMAWLTGSAAIATEIDPGRARTAVKLHSLAVRLPNTTSRTPQSLEPHPDIQLTTAPTKRTAAKPYSFEFAIDGREQLSARRNDFEAALATELAVSYRDPELRVGGYIEFRRGSFELFGKHFEVSRGSMQFDGGTELNPEVSLVAVHQPRLTGSSSVTVNVSGTLAKPSVNFYSERCPGDGAVVLLVSGRCPNESDIAMTDPNATQNAFTTGIIGGILTLGAQKQLSGLIPKLAVESAGRGSRTRVRAGFEAVPPFMRSLVQRVYIQGALSTANSDTSGTGSPSSVATPDFLIELYFPKNIVGSGRVAPTTRSWGFDVTWEP